MDLWTCLVISGVLAQVPFFIGILINIMARITGIKKRKYSSILNEGLTEDIMKHLKKEAIYISEKFSSKDGTAMPSGLILGRYWMAYVSTEINSYDSNMEHFLYLFSTKSTHKRIVESAQKSISDEPKMDDKVACNFTMYHRTGSYYRIEYKKLSFPFRIIDNEKQMNIVRDIEKNMQYSVENGYAENIRVLLHGPSGSGKSIIAFQLAKRLNEKGKEAAICNTFNPSDPGDNIYNLYNRMNNCSNYMIIIIDEWDRVITRKRNTDKIPVEIHDKSSHNRFMDNLIHYERCIFLMTTNQPISWFSKNDDPDVDCSYIRKGRFDLIYQIDEEANLEKRFHEIRFSEPVEIIDPSHAKCE